ncbi:MAG: hypothetical protein ACK443_09945 [Methylococcaceae bacterium]
MIALASKNAILVVEFARELRADGMTIIAATSSRSGCCASICHCVGRPAFS